MIVQRVTLVNLLLKFQINVNFAQHIKTENNVLATATVWWLDLKTATYSTPREWSRRRKRGRPPPHSSHPVLKCLHCNFRVTPLPADVCLWNATVEIIQNNNYNRFYSEQYRTKTVRMFSIDGIIGLGSVCTITFVPEKSMSQHGRRVAGDGWFCAHSKQWTLELRSEIMLSIGHKNSA